MEAITTIILAAAKSVGVSGTLLLAICSHESNNFTMTYSPNDHGSPSYGVCQIKSDSAFQMGFKGLPFELMDPKVNAKYAALYLNYQQKRYGDDWVQLAASYNSGSYHPSKKKVGCPRNLKYVRLVQTKLPEEFQDRLNCGEELAGNP